MLALIALAVLTAFVTQYVVGRIAPARNRQTYLGTVVAFLVIGTSAIILYTIEVATVYGQTEQQGDASSYVAAAEGVLLGHGTTSFYAIYEYFLAAFFWHGGPLTARCGQLLLLICCYSLGALGLVRRGISERSFRWFSGLMCFNGIFYGLVAQLVRDIMLLTALALVFVCVIFIQRPNSGSGMFLNAVLGAGGLAMLFCLSNWVPYVVMGAVAIEMLSVTLRRRGTGARIAVAAAGIAAVVFLCFASNHITTLYHINIDENAFRSAGAKAPGIGTWGTAVDTARNILGPGLLRPLFWEKYFWYSTNVHSALYWWGTLVWYVLLLMVAIRAVPRWKQIWSAPGVRFCGLTLMVLLATYSAAYGSGVGLRKRAIFQFLALLAAASAGLIDPGRRSKTWISGFLADGRSTILTLTLLAAMVAANYLSVE